MKYDSTKDTLEHQDHVVKFIADFINKLSIRGINHDKSKLSEEEKEFFDEFTPKLKNLTYGSDEYKECTKKMVVALNHHYNINRHHPEHFENGIKDMNLIDLIEMFCDWRAAVLRHADGNIVKSIEIQQKKLGFDDILKQIFLNSIKEI